MQAIINPGTGPVEGTSEDQALANMQRIVQCFEDSRIVFQRIPANDYGNGRYAFRMRHESTGLTCYVQMPGLPLSQVEYTAAADQNIWHFPRLYVNGSSWVWCYALSFIGTALYGDEDGAS